jgi:trehalose-phosphatase
MASLALETCEQPWRTAIHSDNLVLLATLDGTLLPFAETADNARLDDEVCQILRAILASGIDVAVLSGRPAPSVDSLRSRLPSAWWFAENGAWRHDESGWSGRAGVDVGLDPIAHELRGVVGRFEGTRVERKTASVCVHWRQVAPGARPELFRTVDPVIDEWLETHPDHERSSGTDLVEVRSKAQHEAAVIAWIRQRKPGARILALGDAATSTDLFLALAEQDLAISVGHPVDRRPHVDGVVDDVRGARRFLGWMIEARRSHHVPPVPLGPSQPRSTLRTRPSLLVISNRIPAPINGERQREVGGLVAALEPALQEHEGVWLGWSGHER